MSPFLFLLIAEALSRLCKQARELGNFKGIHIVRFEYLTHILFVDDILLFGDATEENAKNLKNIRDLYQQET